CKRRRATRARRLHGGGSPPRARPARCSLLAGRPQWGLRAPAKAAPAGGGGGVVPALFVPSAGIGKHLFPVPRYNRERALAWEKMPEFFTPHFGSDRVY